MKAKRVPNTHIKQKPFTMNPSPQRFVGSKAGSPPRNPPVGIQLKNAQVHEFSVLQQQVVPPAHLGRRIDQVQNRRRRVKHARHMKVLYQYTDSIVNDQEGFVFKDPLAASRKLKCIDYLIDMQVNVNKIT